MNIKQTCCRYLADAKLFASLRRRGVLRRLRQAGLVMHLGSMGTIEFRQIRWTYRGDGTRQAGVGSYPDYHLEAFDTGRVYLRGAYYDAIAETVDEVPDKLLSLHRTEAPLQRRLHNMRQDRTHGDAMPERILHHSQRQLTPFHMAVAAKRFEAYGKRLKHESRLNSYHMTLAAKLPTQEPIRVPDPVPDTPEMAEMRRRVARQVINDMLEDIDGRFIRDVAAIMGQ